MASSLPSGPRTLCRPSPLLHPRDCCPSAGPAFSSTLGPLSLCRPGPLLHPRDCCPSVGPALPSLDQAGQSLLPLIPPHPNLVSMVQSECNCETSMFSSQELRTKVHFPGVQDGPSEWTPAFKCTSKSTLVFKMITKRVAVFLN